MSARIPASVRLQSHYADLGKQTHAARLGMWLFLASEVLLFSALFTLYASYRAAHPGVFAEAAHHTSFALGAAMTGVLITSSLFAALSLGAVRADRTRASLGWLLACIGLGIAFLGIKAVEYHSHALEGLLPGIYYSFPELQQPPAIAFFTLYYLMTGLHALHVLAGMLVLGAVTWGLHRNRYDSAYHTPLELGTLYWHLVDIIWIFLWPLFYLLRN